MSKKKNCRLTILLIAAAVILAACSSVDSGTAALTGKAAGEPLPLDPLVISGKLENGLSWFIRPNTEPEHRASLRLVVNAGSVLEADDQQGLAHFCEHMAFNGTEHYEKSELIDYLESIGMHFGPEINAYTGFDETVYMLEIPTDDEEIINNAFQVLEDWAHLVSYEDEEIGKERGVIQEEWRLGRGASGRILDAMVPVLFSGSAYADRLPIGKPEVFMNTPAQRLRDFYNTWYRPDLIAVVVVGDIDPEHAQVLIEKHFSYAGPENPVERPEFPVEPDTANNVLFIPDPELSYATVEISAKTERPGYRTEADYRTLLLKSMTWSMMNDRLGEAAKLPDPPFIGAGGGNGSIVRTAGNVSCYASADTDSVERALTAIVEELERARRYGFTEAELQRKKADYLKSIEEYYKERENIQSSSLASELVDYYLKDVFMPGAAGEYDLYNSIIPGFSIDEINRYAAEMIPENGRTVTVIYPVGANVPGSDRILQIAESGPGMNIQAYVDDSLDQELVSNVPEKGGIVSRTSYDEIGTELWHLSNGADVIIKNTDFKEDEILFSAFSRGGLSLHPDSEFVSGQYATLLETLSGLGDFNSVQLEKRLAGLSIRLSPYIGNNTEGLTGSFSPDETETFMQMLYLYFTDPVFDGKANDNLKERLESLIENRKADPMNEYRDRINEIMTRDDYRSRPLDSERLQGLTAQTAGQVFRSRFSGADDFIFVFTGNIDRPALEAACAQWLSSVPSGIAGEQPRDRGVRPPKGIVSDTVYRGIDPQSRVRISFSTPLGKWTPDAELQIQTAAQVMETLMRESLREDLGGTYHISVKPSVMREPWPSASVNIEFGCDPERTDELSAKVFEIISSVASGSLEEQYIVRQEQQNRRSYEKDVEENQFWLNHLREAFGYGDDPEDILTPEKFDEKISRESIIEAVKTYMDPAEYVIVVLKPESAN